MTTIGPWRPQEETFEEFIQRVIDNAGRPTPEQYDELAALLRLEAVTAEVDTRV